MVEEKKKNAFQKLKEGLDDKEEQLAIISLFVRLGVVCLLYTSPSPRDDR